MSERALLDAFVRELAIVVSAMTGAGPSSPIARKEPAAADGSWTVRVAASGAMSRTLAVRFARAEAVKLSARVMMLDSDPPDADVADTLKELVSQAVGVVSLEPEAKGITLRVQPLVEPDQGSDERGARAAGVAGLASFDLPVDADLTVAIACSFEPGAAPQAQAAGTDAALGLGSAPGLAAEAARGRAGEGALPENLDVILDIDLPLSARFGQAELTLDALTKLGPGSLIELARLPDDPVELLVNGKVVARGEVVVVGGNYGVRVHEVVSAQDRIRTLE